MLSHILSKKVKSMKNVKVPEIASQILESYQKVKPIKNVKVSGIASQILKCCNNRVMCKQGSEQCWAKKEKDKQKVSLVYYKRWLSNR